MSPNTVSPEEVDQLGRPLQLLSWADKDQDWFKKCVNYYITRSNFNFGAQTQGRKDLRVFYEVYNNQFPLEWFNTITNPLSAKKKAHKSFPAKVRPVTILRTNIDLLLGEYPRRPFVYNVENLGENGYNTYMEGLNGKLKANLDQHFIQAALQQMQANGQQLTPEQEQQLQQQPPTPDKIQEDYQSSYKDALAIKGNKWLRRTIRDKFLRRKMHRMFKDWLIAGQCYSRKGVENNELVYEKVSPLNIDFDKSEDNDMIEDGEWVVARKLYTLSDVVDKFYASLTKPQQTDLELKYWYNSPMGFYDHLRGLFTDPAERNKVPVFHVQWKGRKKVLFLTYFDPETFQYVEEEVDENYVVNREMGEQVEERWVNEVYEGWRIGQDIYCNLRAVPVQRNEMNNCSKCKLEYNGRKYSDTHAENISVMEIGMPFQILYIIVTYILEKTIAKSKGKILLIDQNAIPNEGDWDDEKFFYYSEALGYALLNRNQIGVDKSWNQYQVVDMGLFDQIKQLIELRNSFKQDWDDVIGISRQRKGQTYATDGQGVNERAVFQSTVITDMIFIGFEEFVETELQGIMDYAKYLTAKGEKSMYNDDDYGTMLMEIFPGDFTMEELGVFIERSPDIMEKKQKMEQAALQMVANGKTKASTVLEIIDSINIAELKQKLKQVEALEAQIEQSQAQNQQEADKAIEEMKERYLAYGEMLKREYMEAEYDRKEDIEYIKGAFNTFTFKDGDSNANGVPDALEVEKLAQQRDKITQDHSAKLDERKHRNEKLTMERQKMEHDMRMDKENVRIQDNKNAIAKKKASQRPSKN